MNASNTGTGPGADADADDDQHWFDLMAGRAVADAHGRTRADAAWMRAALLAYRAEAPAGSVPAAETRVLRLLHRAVQAGVLPAPTASRAEPDASPWQRLWRRWQAQMTPGRPWRFAPVMLVLALAVGGVWQLQQPAEPERADVERAGAALQRLNVVDPAQHRQQLLASLRAAGLDAQPFDRLGRLGIDIELPAPLSAAQAQALKQAGLVPPAGPNLIVELLPAAPR